MQESFDDLKEMGDKNFKNNDFDVAIMFYSKAILLNQDEKKDLVYLNRGLAYFKLGQFQEALEDAIKASKLNQSNSKAWSRIGSCLFALNRNTEAITAFDRACQLDPSNEDYKKMSLQVLKSIQEPVLKLNQESELKVNQEPELKVNQEPELKVNQEPDSNTNNNMEEMIKKLKKMKGTMGNMGNLPIESLMGPLFNKMMSNEKLINLASDTQFQTQMQKYKDNPLEAMKNPKIMDLVGDVLKELDLNK
jgi:tetratricopeptide (TPR) repeat protein